MDGVTVQRTRMVPPPPLPELLHWLMVAFVVSPSGVQSVVGSVPPPVPEPLHWLIVAGLVAVIAVTLLSKCTVQVTVPPPPLPEPSHWVTEVVSAVNGVVDVVQVGGAFAAPWHSRTVTVELVVPVATSRLLTTVTSQTTACPPTLSVPLHWSTARTVAASAVECVPIPGSTPPISSARPRTASPAPNTPRRRESVFFDWVAFGGRRCGIGSESAVCMGVSPSLGRRCARESTPPAASGHATLWGCLWHRLSSDGHCGTQSARQIGARADWQVHAGGAPRVRGDP